MKIQDKTIKLSKKCRRKTVCLGNGDSNEKKKMKTYNLLILLPHSFGKNFNNEETVSNISRVRKKRTRTN